MKDDEINIDMKFFDDLYDKINGTQMNLFDNIPNNTTASTISQSVSAIWPYVSTGTGNYGLTNAPTNNTGNYTWTTTGTGTVGITNNDWFSVQKNGLHVNGDAEFEGDVKIKGKSISEMLDKIEERLAILHPNEKLEDKWEELKKLGDMYRALEKDIIEKEKIWETLKK